MPPPPQPPPPPLRRLLALVAVEAPALRRAVFHQAMQSLTYIPFTAGLTWFVDHVLHAPPGRSRRTTALLIVGYALANLALWLVHGGFTVAAFAASQRVVRATTARLRRQVVDQLQRLALAFFARHGAGALSNQLTVDMARVESFVGQVAGGLVPGAVLGIATLGYLVALNARLAAVALAMLPLQALVIRAMGRRLDALHAGVQRSGEDFAAGVSELVAGMRHVRTLGNEDRETARLARAIDDVRRTGLAAGLAMTWTALWLQMAQQYVPVLVWCAGGWLALTGRVSLGELVAFVGLLGFVQSGIGAVGSAYQEWTAARPSLAALLALLDAEEVETFADPLDAPRLRGAIEFDDVVFRHAGSDRAVLDGLTLSIAPGERVGLVGESGAGKSTVLDLVAAFHLPERGAVTYDGQPVRALGRRAVRRQTAIMSQEAFLWNASVRENIRVGRPDASDAEVEAAATRAGAAGFVARLERGYDTPCGERGAQLSGGERQRLALARLFLRDPAIVLLDEPTSALDAETAARIQPDLEALCAGRTALIVSHRLALLRGVDRVVVLGHGRVLESGPPAELLARPEGLFARLIAADRGFDEARNEAPAPPPRNA